jgi:uncharacterized membrane protein
MGNRWAGIGLIALVMLCFASSVVADTGGSMGGGSWGGGGGGGGGYSGGGGGGYSGGGGGGWSSSSSSGWSSSSSSDWSSSSSTDWSSGGSSYHSSGGGGCNNVSPAWVAFAGGIFVLFWIATALIDRSNRNATYDFEPYVAPAGVDVSVLRVAIDGRARKFVQSELARIARTTNTATDEGRAAMLREVSMMLRKLRDAWVYGGAVNHPMRDIGDAKREFDRATDDARSRFREEVIRNADGKIDTRAASAYTPRGDEGAGLILVSLVIAARRELFTVREIGSGDDLRGALESASQLTPGNLVAIEIVWQPAEETDRLSSMELEAKYPHPELIPIRGALVGKVFCAYCSGPFPAELVSCPHCGAPAPGRAPKAA